MNLDSRDTPSIHFHNGEAISCEVQALSSAWNKSKSREDERSGCRVGSILRQVNIVARLEVVQAQRGIENHRRICAFPHNERLLHHVVFIMTLTDEVFENVLKRHQPQIA